jgi:hypothetical protein
METFEDLGAAIGTVSHDSEALIDRVLLDGRRRQRRRRLGAGVGAMAAGAVLVGSLFLSGGSPKGDGTAVADQSTPTVEPSGGGQSSPAGDGRVALPSPELTDARLAAGLPEPGKPVSATGNHDYVSVVRTIDPDGSGAASVSLGLNTSPPLSDSEISNADQKCHLVSQLNGAESCKALADGWMFTYKSHPDVQGAAPKALDWSATVVYQDGTSVSLHATNYVDAGDPTRPTPPLDLAQIEALAHDPVWFQPAS